MNNLTETFESRWLQSSVLFKYAFKILTGKVAILDIKTFKDKEYCGKHLRIEITKLPTSENNDYDW